LWDLNGKLLAEFRDHRCVRDRQSGESKAPKCSVNSVWFSRDGKQLATAGDDGTVRRWNFQGQQLEEFQAHLDDVESVRFSPNNQQLATSTNDGS
jgi:WD40 repeat protein